MNPKQVPVENEICESLKKVAIESMQLHWPKSRNYLDEFALNGQTVDFQVEMPSIRTPFDWNSPYSTTRWSDGQNTADYYSSIPNSPVRSTYSDSNSLHSPLSTSGDSGYSAASSPRKLNDFAVSSMEQRAVILAKLKVLWSMSDINKTTGIKQPNLTQQFAGRRRYHRINHEGNECVFCKNNRESPEIVGSHTVKDGMGRVRCPRLRKLVCHICGATGDAAHTIKYCPEKPIITMEDLQMMDELQRIWKRESPQTTAV